MSDALSRLLPAGMHWARPWGLLALLLPLLVLLASLRPALPEPRFTGAIALWRNIRSAAGGGRRRLTVPPARWLWMAAMTLGALALAGPQERPPTPAFTLAVVLDTSPSMGLPHPQGGTRGEAAILALRKWLESEPPVALEHFDGRPLGDLRDLEDPGRGTANLDGERHWPDFDLPGVVWLTDKAPAESPAAAGLCAAGGTAVPGPVAARGADRWWWDGEGLEWRVDSGPPGQLVLVGRIPADLDKLARLWAQERAWEVLEEDSPNAAGLGPSLSIVAHPGLPGELRAIELDGWSTQGRGIVAAPDLSERAEVWLPGLVWSSPGRVDLALAELRAEGADPGAFVTSWANLLDRAVQLPTDVVSLAERGAAGPAVFQAPSLLPRRGDGGDPLLASRLAAWLAAAATALGLAALALSGFARTL